MLECLLWARLSSAHPCPNQRTMDKRTQRRRMRQFKKKTIKSQEERRNAVLQRKQAARRNLTDHARRRALGELEISSFLSESAEDGQAEPTQVDEEPVQMDAASKRKPRRKGRSDANAKKQLRDFYAQQLCKIGRAHV